LFAIARRAEQVGWNIPLKSIVTWGDQLHHHYRDLIERVFSAKVSDTYGCGEGMHIAAQCGHGPHYHIHELDVIAEFLDENGYPVPEGKPGRIVLTRLHAGPMPFVRYEIGDVGVASVGKSCACGRNLKLLESIQGRTADYILTPSGNRLIVHFFTGILEHFKEIDCFQVRQEKLDELRLLILPRGPFSRATESAIRHALQEKGADMKINVELVSEMPMTPGGKRRFIVPSSQFIGDQERRHA
jgi:phenylacetate-CoA ligase